jgi:hypothetical protein
MMKKSTTFFVAKFTDYIGFLENSRFFARSIISDSPELDIVVKGITKPNEFIENFEMKLLV